MKIEQGFPPNIAEIREAFHPPSNAIFCYGDTIYVGRGKPELPGALIAHEEVHSRRQAAHEGGVLGWWDRYIEDPVFRFEEELLAHHAEYQHHVQSGAARPKRRRVLKEIAKRLSGPLYGRIVTFDKAKALIQEKG